ncbi:DUF6599 family protein [Terriglobus roseus]|uniref:Uncharacterized protein n=1 Tax=Terriglobus roseus TaxID=392734 RepID=A0A1G7QVT1_9BACT|nr:DUF6599 family protein [Terriglobus roseus]SDG02636.1 hypothetical protein SAMN05444167_4022 [Terriglobus roseus]
MLRTAHFALVSALLVSSAVAQTPAASTTVSVPPAPLLADHFGPWQASAPATVNDIHLPDDVAKELIVKRSDAKIYEAEGNKAAVSAVELADATGAYSAFTYLRTAEMHPCSTGNSLGVDCAVSSGRLLFWQGDTVVIVAPAGLKGIAAGSFTDLVGTLPKPNGAKAAHPLLPGKLPTDGLEKTSLRYAVGQNTYTAGGGAIPAEVLDFSKSPEILTAHYRSSKSGTGLLTLIFYPTPTIAGDRMRAIQQAISDKKMPASFLAGDPQIARSGPIVAIASSGFTAKEAAKLVGGVKYQAQIAWDKPEGYMEQFKVSAAASVLVQIMIFVFVMCGAALALGIVFGGGRAAFRISRGKSASSLADMEVISLGLRGKPEHKIQS